LIASYAASVAENREKKNYGYYESWFSAPDPFIECSFGYALDIFRASHLEANFVVSTCSAGNAIPKPKKKFSSCADRVRQFI